MTSLTVLPGPVAADTHPLYSPPRPHPEPVATLHALANMGRNLIRYRIHGPHAMLRPLFISWEINSVCNLRCPYCYLHDRSYGFSDRGLSFEDIKKVLRRIRRVCGDVMLLGGEPFLHPAWDAIVAYCRNNLKLRVRCITNGTRLVDHLDSVRQLSLLVVSYDQKRCTEYPEAMADMRRQLRAVTRACPDLAILVNFVLCADDDPGWVIDRFERFARRGLNIFVNVDRHCGPGGVDRRIVDALRRIKHQTGCVHMTDTTLNRLYDTSRTAPFCHPTLLPVLDPRARLIYPCCYYDEQHAGSLLEMDYDTLLRVSSARYGRYPFDKCAACTTTAYLDAAVTVRKPVEGIRHYHGLYNH